MTQSTHSIGILAYGSLIDDPGEELKKIIIDIINCETPFEIEFDRISKTRDNAPTLIPVSDGQGSKVNAKILVLDKSVSIDDAKNILWRRETRNTNKSKRYKQPLKGSKNAVSIIEIENFEGIDKVLYTSIPSNMGTLNSPEILAKFAIESILSEAGDKHLDGVRYLLNAKKNHLTTPKSAEYESTILTATGAKDLESAIAILDKERPNALKVRQDLKDFEDQVIPIADYAFNYGLNHTIPVLPDNPSEAVELMKENKERFLINCHTGFKKAQDKIIELLLKLEDEFEENKARIKKFRKSKNPKAAKALENENKRIEFKERVLRHIIDGIAWQMIKGQLYIARRFYQEVEGKKLLKHSNIKSALEVANSINQNERDFALITDLSSYIQIGDLLCIQNGKMIAIEVKEGEHNSKILEIAHEVMSGEKETLDILKERQLDKKSTEQLIRQLKQYAVGQNLANIINYDEGVDTSTGQPFKVFTPDIPTQKYDDRLAACRDQLATRNLWGYDVIDGCLHIGIYKGDFRFIGEKLLRSVVELKTKNYIIHDLRSIMDSMNRPLFFFPFPKDFIFDVIFGRINIFMALDLDKYIELFNEAGYKAEWASRKETMKAIETSGSSKNLILKDNKGIKVTSKNGDMWLAYGSVLKIFFELITPSYTVFSTKYYEGISDN